MTETALAELLSRDLSALDLLALMIDRLHFASRAMYGAHIFIDSVKTAGVLDGSTENATLVSNLQVDLRERGLHVTVNAGVPPGPGSAQRRPLRAAAPSDPTRQIHNSRNVKYHSRNATPKLL